MKGVCQKPVEMNEVFFFKKKWVFSVSLSKGCKERRRKCRKKRERRKGKKGEKILGVLADIYILQSKGRLLYRTRRATVAACVTCGWALIRWFAQTPILSNSVTPWTHVLLWRDRFRTAWARPHTYSGYTHALKFFHFKGSPITVCLRSRLLMVRKILWTWASENFGTFIFGHTCVYILTHVSRDLWGCGLRAVGCHLGSCVPVAPNDLICGKLLS